MDEAYREYVGEANYPHSIALLKKYRNLFITRTFSKIYGLASLRMGYGIGDPEIISLLNRVRLPFNVNALALAAAEACLDDKEHLEKSFQVNQSGRAYLLAELSKLSVSVIANQVGNFITFDCHQDATQIFEALLQHGVIVRPLTNYQMPQHLRVTIGTAEQNERFIKNLTTVL